MLVNQPYCNCAFASTATWTTQTISAVTTATHFWCSCRYTAINYYIVEPKELPKCEHESIIQMRRINLMADRRVCPKRKPQRAIGRVCVPILPRQRIRGWPSLKERRASWKLDA